MGTVLTVLKIIGIVLGSILALTLLIILLILFVPVRYKVDALIQETDLEKDADKLKDNISACASFSWLLHFISGGISYPESKEFYIKVLCFKVYPPKNKKNDDLEEYDLEDEIYSENQDKLTEMEEGLPEVKAEDESAKTSENEHDIEQQTEAPWNEHAIEQQTDAQNTDETAPEKAADSAEDIPSETDEENIRESETEDDFEDDDKGFFDIIEKIFETIARIIKVPQDVFTKIQYTISRIYAKIDMVKNTLSNDIFKRAFEITKKHLFRVIRMILPKKFKVNLLVGMEDPTVTADILAAYGVLYPVVYNKVYVTPDFDRKILAGEAHIKGRITIFTIVFSAAVLYFNKDVKKTIKRFNKIINS
ncbi:DUF2953 domain-containing protein [Butyrivibrio sp. LC3010]|uniref:DUF2953 domain-containing protein n=1 Tax=Butyrivibrio sp. LC3010 TaxID=1280680 RepID=UPI00041343A4|nr:DUF2953 domain-containing protein [Butyrivibrio sp. LC3010]